MEDGIVVKGHRTVIPHSLLAPYIDIMHRGPPGLELTKCRARMTVFWPTMNRDITEKLLSCSVYNSTQAHQQKEPLQPHPVPVLPWSTVATDVFEWHGQQYMVLVDSYSGWFEIDLLRNTSSAAVITKLKRHFSVHGSPHTLINDNARYYTSQHFKEFAEQWDFVHVTSSTEYPQSNGPAERAVRSAKQLMERSHRDGTDVFLNLLNVRNIPHDKTLGSPAECLMSRQTRSTLPVSSRVLAPAPKNTKQVIAQHQKKRLIQKQYYDASSHPLQPLAEGQVIRMQTTKGHDRLGIVKEVCHTPKSSNLMGVSTGEIAATSFRLLSHHHRWTLQTLITRQLPQLSQTFPLPHRRCCRHSTSVQQRPVACSSAKVTYANTPYVTQAGGICKPNPKYGQWTLGINSPQTRDYF